MEGRDAIAGSRPSRFSDVRRVEVTGSTNTDVLELARQGAPEGVVVVADQQTAGRGRAGRSWTAPPGASLLCTMLLRPPASVASLATFALAVAAAEAVEELSAVRPGLKWPNDLVIESDGRTRKLAGILAEAEWPAAAHAAIGFREPAAHARATVAAGIGVNVDWPDELPDELAEIAVSIAQVSDRVPSRDRLLEVLLERFDRSYGALCGDDGGRVLDRWRDRSVTLGRRVRVDLGGEEIEGTATDITASGHLLVEEGGSGTIREFAVGDVVHLRPTA